MKSKKNSGATYETYELTLPWLVLRRPADWTGKARLEFSIVMSSKYYLMNSTEWDPMNGHEVMKCFDNYQSLLNRLLLKTHRLMKKEVCLVAYPCGHAFGRLSKDHSGAIQWWFISNKPFEATITLLIVSRQLTNKLWTITESPRHSNLLSFRNKGRNFDRINADKRNTYVALLNDSAWIT